MPTKWGFLSIVSPIIIIVIALFFVPSRIWRKVDDFFRRIGRVYRRFISDPWRKYKSRIAFHRREPRPPPKARRRSVSEGKVVDQRASMFMTKLPPEIRLMIYKEAIIGDEVYWHITECRNPQTGKRLSVAKKNSLWAFKSNVQRMKRASVASQICYFLEGHRGLTPHEVDPNLLRCGLSAIPTHGIAITRTCRQIYLESTSVLYSQYHGIV